jgi:hypothetical protein
VVNIKSGRNTFHCTSTRPSKWLQNASSKETARETASDASRDASRASHHALSTIYQLSQRSPPARACACICALGLRSAAKLSSAPEQSPAAIMAFVHRSKRTTTLPSSTTSSSIGPGSYITPAPFLAQPKLSYAPFASSAERGIEDRYVGDGGAPGPGAYEKPSYTGSLGGQMSTAFVSGVPRFGNEAESAGIPGPGQFIEQRL